MSKISIEGNASGSGTLTIAAPNTNSNYTLTLPESTGTMVVTGGAQTIEFAAGTVSAPSITTTGDTNTGIFFPAADTIAFTEGGTEAMRIDSSGQVGVGVTPSAWGPAGSKAVQVIRGSLWHDNSGFFSVSNNAYYDGSNWKYINSSYASQHAQVNGTHQWFTAAEGTAGNNITFAERMRIDNSGNVGIGTSSPISLGSGFTTLTINGAGGGGISMAKSDTQYGYVYADNNNLSVQTTTTIPIILATNNAERMRIGSNGNVSVNSTDTSYAKFVSRGTGSYAVIASDPSFSVLAYNEGDANNTSDVFFVGRGGTDYTNFAGTNRIIIWSNGDVVNTNDQYGPIASDQRLKQDIVDAGSQWDDLKNLRIRKFHYRNDPDGHLQIGCIAQEAEQVSPGLVYRRPVNEGDVLTNPELGTLVDDLEKPIKDEEGNITGYEKKVETDTEVLSFKSSILFWKATKALQEAMERIETLETNNAALEARIAAIENGA